MELWTDDFGQVINVHEVGDCAGFYCTIHSPSNHALSEAPQMWAGKFMVRVCVHNEQHVDYDELNTALVRSCAERCDGCCVFEEKE